MYEQQIIPAKKQGLSACVYVQLSDVEDEVNGIMTYDRKVLKADKNTFLSINGKLKNE